VHQTTPQITNVVELLNANDTAAVAALFAQAHPADIADSLEQLTPANRPLAWVHIPKEVKGDVLTELSEGVFKNLAHELDNKELVNAIKVLDIDELADNLGEVLSYPEDSAGGLMNIDTTTVRDNISLDVVLHYLRLKSELPEHTDTIYLVDRQNRLTGILPIHRLITQPGNDPAITHAVRPYLCASS